MLPKLTFVLGGAASGKSAFAENLIVQTGAPRVYIATAEVYDSEMEAKVQRHKTMRGPNWRSIEAPRDLGPAFTSVSKDEIALLDCATMWLTNHMMGEADIEAQTSDLLHQLATCEGRVVVVSNEVGMGIVPDNAMARRFRDLQGRLNQRLADQSELAVFVVAGQPLVLKGTLP
ncbi:bifunctional adenosylcobinamide kinase/adenosylcobinamide-phosphate guanylyltransferase [Cognatishimia maritima]|uniref:Bifunctional adenosylcobalamin biosynthesis protein n=1 Tax=Cognatishimia maritima TaxID=870908 RepID=A0A1M5S0G4_9RHOB|nr:bifunctional adenosylcobinamide kinase/adenosylcobinamide-phosphate guanylyltransferase [Cognatishimia maritima]SHH31955.1 adenosylcobinamide kinase /adenosylcobinamide-phosphate guanylyltransferase [Cognatishimia maritima]